MLTNEVTKNIVDAAYQVHVKLGPGLLESVYEAALFYELTKRGLVVQKQVPIKVIYDGQDLGLGFRADLIIEKTVIVELKSVIAIIDVHKKQLLSYLKLANKRVGLLINFNEALIKNGITRIVNNLY